MYFQCLFGEDFLDIFRPFDYAQISAVNVVKETDIEGLFNLVDSVKIEVKNGRTVRSLIFIDNGECRRTDSIFLDTLSDLLSVCET